MRGRVLVFGAVALASVIANFAIANTTNARVFDTSGSLELSSDITDGIYVQSGTNITLNLNDITVSPEAGKDTIYIEKGATLTLTGTGTITNVAGKANIFNNGKLYVNGNITIKHAGDYYAILNHGELADIKSATITAEPSTNSVIVNGYASYGSNNHRLGYVEDINFDAPAMVLYDGVKVDLGITENCTIKNDDNGYMTIHGGYYSAENACALQNANVAEINGGTFIQKLNNDPIITNLPLNDSINKGKLSITGGEFFYNSEEDKYLIENVDANLDPFEPEEVDIVISGGTFSTNPKAEWIDPEVNFALKDGRWVVDTPTEPEEEPVDGPVDNDIVNPSTADNMPIFIIALIGSILVLGATIYAYKKSRSEA